MSEIKKLLTQGEGRKLEFKEVLPSNEKIIKTAMGSGYSELRNQNLGNLLKRFSIIEQWGSGYKKIITELNKYKNIEDSSRFTQVKFIKRELVENEGINEGINSLFHLIQNSPNRRTSFFAQELNTSVKNIERWIKQLKDENKIEYRGSKKTGGYFAK